MIRSLPTININTSNTYTSNNLYKSVNFVFCLLMIAGYSLSSAAEVAPNDLTDSTNFTESETVIDSASVEKQIQRIESEQGPFGAGLSEHLQSLATQYQNDGLHEEALTVFNRAIHVQRINGGLYDLSQAPMIEQAIQSHIAVGDWGEASKRHEHLFWLHQRNFGQDDPRMLPILEKLSSWHLNAYSLNRGPVASHLLNAYSLLQSSVSLISTNFGENDTRLINPLRGIAISNYYFATLTLDQIQQKATISTGPSNAAEAERRARLEQFARNSYYSGKTAMLKILDIFEKNEGTDPVEVMVAQVQLGDWYTMFNLPNSAQKEYESALSLVLKNDSHEPLAQTARDLFSKPVALPDLPVFETEVFDNNEPHDYVLVKFDVNERGQTRNIDIIESKPSDSVGLRVNIRRALKSAKFRPRYEDGKAVKTEGLVHRYVFPKKS